MKSWIGIFLLAILISCSQQHDAAHETVIDIPEEAKDIKVPASLWTSFEGADQKGLSYIFVPITMTFEEKNEGVLKQNKFSFKFPRGGGTVDLSEYVTEKAGSFYVQFELPENLDQKDLKVYFISHTKKRKLGDEILGAGCGVYLDISKKFTSHFVNDAFKVNTTRSRHVTVLGGTFIFSLRQDNQMFISQVTFEDSRDKQLFCEATP